MLGVSHRRDQERLCRLCANTISLQLWELRSFQVWKGGQISEAMHHPSPGAAACEAVAAEMEQAELAG